MKVKLVKRTLVVKNTLLFLIMGLAYLQIIHSLRNGESAASLESFISLLKLQPALIGAFVLSFISIFFATMGSRFFFLAFQFLIIGQSLMMFIETFDKVILVLNFVYILSAYYFYLFWNLEMSEAFYKPFFHKASIGRVVSQNLPVEVRSEGISLDGKISNWDHSGLFVHLDDHAKLLSGKVLLKIKFEDLDFSNTAQVISRYGNGVGLRILPTSKEGLSWDQFYDIIDDRGLRPVQNP